MHEYALFNAFHCGTHFQAWKQRFHEFILRLGPFLPLNKFFSVAIDFRSSNTNAISAVHTDSNVSVLHEPYESRFICIRNHLVP